ncbi:MAG: hypothetical protein J6C46_06190 [Clostridia bacterium]|nr:hypothetical protein [Clostridia bacterium]
MKNNKAISMISLIITIVLIIIIAAITSFYLSSVIEDTQYKDAKEELKNVENVVEYAKAQILIDEFEPNEAWKITDSELDYKFKKILSDEEIEHIKLVNNSEDIKAPYKFYLMNQKRFDQEFGNDYNVSNLRPAREYLVNYMDTSVVSTYSNERIATTEDIIGEEDPERAEINVVFAPNGNVEWSKQQATLININSNSAATIKSSKYLWTQSYTEPNKGEFIENISDGQTINLSGKTGNDWYAWVLIEYTENNIDKTMLVKSEPFYVDNIAPTADLTIESINK